MMQTTQNYFWVYGQADDTQTLMKKLSSYKVFMNLKVYIINLFLPNGDPAGRCYVVDGKELPELTF